MNFLTKFKRKMCRELCRSGFLPNKLRVMFLRSAGAKVGEDVYLSPSWRLFCNYGEEHLLTIDDRACIAASISPSSNPNNSQVTKYYPQVVKIGRVHIEHDVYCAMNSMILPGVTIGKFSIVGAGALVIHDVPPFTIVAGIPAKIIKKIEVDDENNV
jgi:maltose O-acetyltransferase